MIIKKRIKIILTLIIISEVEVVVAIIVAIINVIKSIIIIIIRIIVEIITIEISLVNLEEISITLILSTIILY